MELPDIELLAGFLALWVLAIVPDDMEPEDMEPEDMEPDGAVPFDIAPAGIAVELMLF